jgi:hypothetical protein
MSYELWVMSYELWVMSYEFPCSMDNTRKASSTINYLAQSATKGLTRSTIHYSLFIINFQFSPFNYLAQSATKPEAWHYQLSPI